VPRHRGTHSGSNCGRSANRSAGIRSLVLIREIEERWLEGWVDGGVLDGEGLREESDGGIRSDRPTFAVEPPVTCVDNDTGASILRALRTSPA